MNRLESGILGFLYGQMISVAVGNNNEVQVMMAGVTFVLWVAVCLFGEVRRSR